MFPPWFRKKGPRASKEVPLRQDDGLPRHHRAALLREDRQGNSSPTSAHLSATTRAARRSSVRSRNADGNPTRITHGQYTKVKLAPFNPGSRDEVADRLTTYRNWKPLSLPMGGAPKVSEEVLEKLPWPEAKLVAEYYTVQKRLGQVSEGNKAWLKNMRSDGRLPAGPTPMGPLRAA